MALCAFSWFCAGAGDAMPPWVRGGIIPGLGLEAARSRRILQNWRGIRTIPKPRRSVPYLSYGASSVPPCFTPFCFLMEIGVKAVCLGCCSADFVLLLSCKSSN
jgi:hypothetical protein